MKHSTGASPRSNMDQPLIYNPTINQQIRNRKILRNEHGLPTVLEPFKVFAPVNPAESKQTIRNDAFTIFENEYDLKRKAEEARRKKT